MIMLRRKIFFSSYFCSKHRVWVHFTQNLCLEQNEKFNVYPCTPQFYHYVNVSVLIKFSQKTSVFYLNYHKFSIKSYVLDVY